MQSKTSAMSRPPRRPGARQRLAAERAARQRAARRRRMLIALGSAIDGSANVIITAINHVLRDQASRG